jgi:hypothetical protein
LRSAVFETLAQWRVKDPEFDRALSQARLHAVEKRWQQIQKAAEDRLDADGKLIKAGDWKSLAWQLERAYPADFSRPEVQINLAIQNNVVENSLTINITAAEYAAIESEAGVRQLGSRLSIPGVASFRSSTISRRSYAKSSTGIRARLAPSRSCAGTAKDFGMELVSDDKTVSIFALGETEEH